MLAQQEVEHKAAADVRAGAAAVGEDDLVAAAGLFEGVGKDRHALEGALRPDRLGELDQCAAPPCGIDRDRAEEIADDFAEQRAGLILLCHLSRRPLWNAHEVTQHQLLGRFEPKPVADLPMDLRERRAPPIRPRGKKPAAGAPGGSVPGAAATPARPGSCKPASR